MECPRCNSISGDAAKFCFNCGAPLRLSCHQCGASANPATAEHCELCGASLAQTSQSREAFRAGSQAPLSDLDRSLGFVEGERKFVTVLFADIRGSLELITGRDPETVRSILGRAIDAVLEPIHRFDGIINRVQGDGIMALFGAPIAHEDHALGACYAAIAMQAAMVERSRSARERYGVELQLRIGLNSGVVVVHTVKNDLSAVYDATGEAVHIAARMEQLCTPGGIWMTSATHKLVKDAIAVRPLGRIVVKGLNQPTEAFEVIGGKPGWRPRPRHTERRQTSFVGRRAEITTIRDALTTARHGRGQVLGVVGPPGSGKSRLVDEALSLTRNHDYLLLRNRAISFDQNISYSLIAKILADYFDFQDPDTAPVMRDKIVAAVGHNAHLQSRLTGLFALYNLPIADAEWKALEPAQRRRRILDAICTLFIQLSERRPLVMVFEDLHWIDAETHSAIDMLVDRVDAAAALIVLTFRPEYRHQWSTRASYSEITLPPLDKSDVTKFLDGLLGTGSELLPIRQLIIDRTEGNPFFIEECVHALVDEGILEHDGRQFRVLKSVDRVQVPDNVRAVVAARIDRLVLIDRRILASASVIGRDVSIDLLSKIVPVSQQSLAAALRRLEIGDFMHLQTKYPDLQYAFRHPIIHEVAYTSQLKDQRQNLHARTLGAMEELYSDRLEDHVEQLAFQAAHSGEYGKIVRYSKQAALKAAVRSANQDAVAILGEALAGIRDIADDQSTRLALVDICLALREPLFRLGRLQQVAECLDEAGTHLAHLNDDERSGQLLLFQSHVRWLTGEHKEAVAAALAARGIAARNNDTALDARAVFQLGLCDFALCDFNSCIKSMRETLAHLENQALRDWQTSLHPGSRQQGYGLDRPLLIVASSYLVRALLELGQFPEAERVTADALQHADIVSKPFSYVFAYLAAAYTHERQSRCADAIQWFERCLEQCQVAQAHLMIPPVASALGLAYARAGRVDDAIALLNSAVNDARKMRLMFHQPLRLAQLAEGLFKADRAVEALDCADAARELAVHQAERGICAYAEYLMGLVLSRLEPGNPDKIVAHYQNACVIADELALQPLAAQIRHTQAEFCSGTCSTLL
jgi:class 3 adenylate cyclase/tetratricopeptide (TPR) repeat protein